MDMGLYEQLSESFPEEDTPFGLCLLVPTQAFKTEWSQQLTREGVKVFQQSYNGRMFFFLKKPNADEPKLKPMEWNEENLKLAQQLQAQGLGYRRIARKFRELGYKVSHTTIKEKLKVKANCDGDVDVVGEFIEALRLLYPKHRQIVMFLIEHGSELVNGKGFVTVKPQSFH